MWMTSFVSIPFNSEIVLSLTEVDRVSLAMIFRAVVFLVTKISGVLEHLRLKVANITQEEIITIKVSKARLTEST